MRGSAGAEASAPPSPGQEAGTGGSTTPAPRSAPQSGGALPAHQGQEETWLQGPSNVAEAQPSSSPPRPLLHVRESEMATEGARLNPVYRWVRRGRRSPKVQLCTR